ncbi:hypothetical protein [Nocardiopsis sp. NRRL B-16309]|uniref:hypothetical protein n=1 Tax=Nocardiopsis sp. NRRL B-16309 TaxID=1519494 RepID=UPI0012E154D4|nr:hypothetical protein [Nocardiopsis sp. NRRL B-16309]
MDLALLARRLPRLEREFSDAVWRILIEHVRSKGGVWVVAAVGLATSALWSVADRVSRGRPFGRRREELEAELVAAFVAELHAVDVTPPNVLGRMWASVYRVGQRWRYSAKRDLAQLTGTCEAHTRPEAEGHPETPLAALVRAGLITAVEAELIAATRLDRRPLHEVADRLGVAFRTAQRRRRRAESVAVAWLRKEISG